MNILAIESSCDETACSIVKDGVKELSSVVSSSAKLHEETGGVVPEVAARKQVEYIVPVLDKCLQSFVGENRDSFLQFGKGIDAIAVTVGPGLIGSLLVGVEAAKTLALAWHKPLIPVNHLVGHIYANYLSPTESSQGEPWRSPELPAVVLIVSGGHTDLVLMKDHGKFEYLGGTIDDAAGEAFDKTARLLGLSKYLGGVELSKLAATCTNNTLIGTLPRPLINKNDFDFSFSGLKTAVKYLIQKNSDIPKEVVACEFENAVCDVLVKKTMKAVKKHKVKTLMLGGGVAANTQLRNRLKQESSSIGINIHIPPLRLCGDNAIYIASAAYFNNVSKPLKDIEANPGLSIMDIYP